MSAHGIAIDDRDPEHVVVTWPSRAVGPDELERFADDVIARMARAPRAVLIDARNAAPLLPRALARLPAVDAKVSAIPGVAGRAVIVPSALAKRIANLAIAALRPRVPTRAFDDLEAARAWLAQLR